MGRENWGNTFRHQHSGVVTVSAMFQPIPLLPLPLLLSPAHWLSGKGEAGPSSQKGGLALGVRGWVVLAGWLEVFSQIVEVDTLLLPAPPSHLL